MNSLRLATSREPPVLALYQLKSGTLTGIAPIATNSIPSQTTIFHEQWSNVADLRPRPDQHSIQVSPSFHLPMRNSGRYLAHSFDGNCKVVVQSPIASSSSSSLSDCSPRLDGLFREHCDRDVAATTGGTLHVVARRDIAAGEVLSFDYNCTEWEMANPFVDDKTGKTVGGCKRLTHEEKERMLETDGIARHIRELIFKERAVLQAARR